MSEVDVFSEDKASHFACFKTGEEDDRHILRRFFQTFQRLLYFGGPTMDVKATITALTLAVMSYHEVISDLAVARQMVVIKTKITTYIKERYE